MDTITLLKLTHRYPDTGPMVAEWAPVATAAGEASDLPGGGLKVETAFRPDLARGRRIEFGGRRFVVRQALDFLGRGERLVLTCAEDA